MRAALQIPSGFATRSRVCSRCASAGMVQASVNLAAKAQNSNTASRRHASSATQGRRCGNEISRMVAAQVGEANSSKMQNMTKAKIPGDVGLFPKTFVAAPLVDYLRIAFSKPTLFLRILWMLFKKPFMNNFGLVYNLAWTRRKGFRVFSTASLRKRPIPLHLTSRITDALTLHRELNTAIAAGDKHWLRAHCCTGLATKACNRIERRGATKSGASNQEHWELLSYGGLPVLGSKVPPWPLCSWMPGKAYKVVNDVVGALPVSNDVLIRQVIVRITSKQKYNLNNGKGDQQKTLTEYVVLQKILFQGEDEGWKVWGTVKPNTVEEIQAMVEEDKKEGSLMDRVRALMPSQGGGMGPMV